MTTETLPADLLRRRAKPVTGLTLEVSRPQLGMMLALSRIWRRSLDKAWTTRHYQQSVRGLQLARQADDRWRLHLI